MIRIDCFAKGVTDDKGQINFGNLAPGKYMVVIDGKGLALALKKIDPKGLPHTIGVTFGLPDQKPIVSSDLPYNGGDAASLRSVSLSQLSATWRGPSRTIMWDRLSGEVTTRPKMGGAAALSDDGPSQICQLACKPGSVRRRLPAA